VSIFVTNLPYLGKEKRQTRWTCRNKNNQIRALITIILLTVLRVWDNSPRPLDNRQSVRSKIYRFNSLFRLLLYIYIYTEMSAISRSANSRIELLWRNMGYSYLFFNAIWISFKSVFSLVRVIDINIMLCRKENRALNFLSWESTFTHLLTFVCCLSPSQLLIKKSDPKVCSNQTHLAWPIFSFD
jgi:hypothetical protein